MVLDGEGIATRKWDGTACLVRDGILYKRYDRKLNPKTGEYKSAPIGWEPCEEPDEITIIGQDGYQLEIVMMINGFVQLGSLSKRPCQMVLMS